MSPLYVLSYCCISISYLVIFQSVSTESLQLEIKEEIYLHSERYRREVSNDDKETEEIASPCPGGQEYCESADDYPTNKIKDLLKKQPKFVLNHFNNERDNKPKEFGPYSPAPAPPAYVPGTGSGTGTGTGTAAGGGLAYDIPMAAVDFPLCSSVKTVIYPKKAKSNDGFYQFVVNDDEHKQGVRVEVCLIAARLMDDGCNIPGSLSYGYTSRCEQKHIQRTLVVLNSNLSDTEGFITKPFEFPSCCSCMITMTSDPYHTTPFDTDWYNATTGMPDLSNTSTTDMPVLSNTSITGIPDLSNTSTTGMPDLSNTSTTGMPDLSNTSTTGMPDLSNTSTTGMPDLSNTSTTDAIILNLTSPSSNSTN